MQRTKPNTTDVTQLSSSIAVMKNSMRIALSSLAFQRGLFPVEAFKPKEYCGIRLMVLKPEYQTEDKKERKDPWAKLLLDILEKGVFDALEKQYCTRIMINIHNRDPYEGGTDANSILESYSFSIDYATEIKLQQRKKDGANYSADKIVGQTKKLLNSLSATTSSLPNLPKNTWITFYLTYSSNTPDSYEPPMFESSQMKIIPVFRQGFHAVSIGGTKTVHQDLGMKLRHTYENLATVPVIPSDHEEEAFVSDDDADTVVSNGKSAMAHWDTCREEIFESFRKMALDKPHESASEILRNTEWGYSISDKVKSDFLARLESETGRRSTSNLPLKEINFSQDSFESARENTRRLSRSKRSIASVVEKTSNHLKKPRR